ncbi:TPA: LytR C-terminal domain-containing protein [Corynebacterium striatum]|nr:LytR C-terminal domain-containing protein [Corynebacterium striatum]
MTNVNSDNSAESTPTDASTDAFSGASTGAAAGGANGLPLRGLAMVLIAVAVMLGMWGLYMLTSEDSSDTASQTGASEAATLPAPAEGEPGAQGGKPASAAQQAPGESAQASNPAAAGAAGEKRENAGEGENAADRDGQDGAQGEAAKRTAKDIPVNVFNNSGRAGYADEESTKLKDHGFKVGEVGNLPGDVLTVPQTMVYYPAGDKDAESLARQTAVELYGANAVPQGAVAKYPAELGENYTKGNAVVAVLAVPQA